MAEADNKLLKQEQRQETTQRIDPKLIMANNILQLNRVELQNSIQDELMENPALEILDDQPICNGNCVDKINCPWCSKEFITDSGDDPGSYDVDTDADYFSGRSQAADDDIDMLGNIPVEESLKDHLLFLAHTVLDVKEYPIGEYLINSLDDNGWLDGNLSDIANDLHISEERAEKVLKVIQSFDPPGVGARNLQECLLIQLNFLDDEGCGDSYAKEIIKSHFDDITSKKISHIARSLGITVETTRKSIEFIQKQLNPYPANQFHPPWVYKPTNTKSVIKPDVIIHRNETGYLVEITGYDTMTIGVSPLYREAYEKLKNGGRYHMSEEERKHITEYVERAELFIRNINQRRKTLKIITQKIIDCQLGFLETGSRTYLRPLTRTRIAEIVGMHESTVSRATANKFVQLPNQEVVSFELFFNTSMAIKSAIEEIIAQENPNTPYSDREIVNILNSRGMHIARRTIVKYREAQKLPPSIRRRR